MKKASSKTVIPVILLAAVFLALAIVTGYALSLKSQVTGQYAEILPVIPPQESEGVLRTAVPATPSPAPTIGPIPAVDEADADAPTVGSPFWSDGMLYINDTYRSPTMTVTVTTNKDSELFDKRLIYYVADVHVSDVTQIRTTCASGDFAKARSGQVEKIARKADALVAISGDYCSARTRTLIIRNGEVYKKSIGDGDVCLLLRNGEMVTMRSADANLNKILEMDPWQAWEFGPALFDSKGNPIKSFPGIGIAVGNPRSCIGYIEPGHYCFVVVDGRQTVSRGVTLKELALLMQSLGCRQAYNLDGGASAQFFYQDTILNHPSGGGRPVADIIYVAYEPYPESRFYCGKAGLAK